MEKRSTENPKPLGTVYKEFDTRRLISYLLDVLIFTVLIENKISRGEPTRMICHITNIWSSIHKQAQCGDFNP